MKLVILNKCALNESRRPRLQMRAQWSLSTGLNEIFFVYRMRALSECRLSLSSYIASVHLTEFEVLQRKSTLNEARRPGKR